MVFHVLNRGVGRHVLREGLVSKKPYERTLASSLFMSFQKLDGQPVPDAANPNESNMYRGHYE